MSEPTTIPNILYTREDGELRAQAREELTMPDPTGLFKDLLTTERSEGGKCNADAS